MAKTRPSSVPTYDVVVVGSGIAGALIAYPLAKARYKVLILEAGGMPSEWNGRKLLIDGFAASSSKGADSPYIEEADTPYYKSPPSANAPQPLDEADKPYYLNPDGSPNKTFKSFYERLVGGALWHWQGIVLRMVPDDFRLASAFQLRDVSSEVRDWPFGYEELAPYYRKAEYEMGVSGHLPTEESLDRYFKVPVSARGRGYPTQLQQGIPQSYMDHYLARKLSGMDFVETVDNREHRTPLRLTPLSQARNSEPFDGRPACDGRATCIPVCPTRAKYEALFHIEKAVNLGAELRANAVVTKLAFGENGAVTEVLYKDRPGAKEKKVAGRIVVLAANAIESPRLLQISERANGSRGNPVVGKYLMDHPIGGSYGLLPEPIYSFRGPQTTSHIETLRDGPFRKFRAPFKISFRNDGWWSNVGAPRGRNHFPPEMISGANLDQSDRAGTVLDLVHNFKMIGSQLRQKLESHCHRQISLGSALEQLPTERNWVDVDLTPGGPRDVYDMPLPRLQYQFDNSPDYIRGGLKAIRAVHEQIYKRLGATAYRINIDQDGNLLGADPTGKTKIDNMGYGGSGHIMGTTTMGKAGEKRVVDSDCRSVDHANLFIVGSSVFPSGAVANPTLTIAALSLRAADAIHKELERTASAERLV
jgi:choline dehydrogenase-like flavoprotein